MKEDIGDIWDMKCDWRCITTNGAIKRNGEAVMGRGVAREAAKKYSDLPRELGAHIRVWGNVLGMFKEYKIITFPVKHHWMTKADMELIKKSAKDLASFAKKYRHETFVLTRPGCRNGRLDWKDVKKAIRHILPDNVTVVTKPTD